MIHLLLVIYKVLALACACSKTDRKTTTGCNNVPALRQIQLLAIMGHLLLVHVMC